MNEECIIRKLVADGDGAGDDRRFATLASLIMKLIKDPENARRLANSATFLFSCTCWRD